MPVYTITTMNRLNRSTRDKTAGVITDIHCLITGAPPELVNVIFMEGHFLKDNKVLGVIASVRKGGNRNKELTENLQANIHTGVATATNIPKTLISCSLVGFPASWGMEGGKMLPEPGKENQY